MVVQARILIVWAEDLGQASVQGQAQVQMQAQVQVHAQVRVLGPGPAPGPWEAELLGQTPPPVAALDLVMPDGLQELGRWMASMTWPWLTSSWYSAV